MRKRKSLVVRVGTPPSSYSMDELSTLIIFSKRVVVTTIFISFYVSSILSLHTLVNIILSIDYTTIDRENVVDFSTDL